MRLVRQIFVSAMMFFGCKLSNVNPLKCASMSNQECKIKPEIITVNSDEPSFYPYCVKQNTCNGSWNNINDAYAKICVPNIVKNINLKVLNLILRANTAGAELPPLCTSI